ncbi:MAG: hypothetical protein ACK4J0_02500 [Candidatus Anstonellaceae archaeon]
MNLLKQNRPKKFNLENQPHQKKNIISRTLQFFKKKERLENFEKEPVVEKPQNQKTAKHEEEERIEENIIHEELNKNRKIFLGKLNINKLDFLMKIIKTGFLVGGSILGISLLSYNPVPLIKEISSYMVGISAIAYFVTSNIVAKKSKGYALLSPKKMKLNLLTILRNGLIISFLYGVSNTPYILSKMSLVKEVNDLKGFLFGIIKSSSEILSGPFKLVPQLMEFIRTNPFVTSVVSISLAIILHIWGIKDLRKEIVEDSLNLSNKEKQ